MIYSGWRDLRPFRTGEDHKVCGAATVGMVAQKAGTRGAGSSPRHCRLRTTGEEPGKTDEALLGFSW